LFAENFPFYNCCLDSSSLFCAVSLSFLNSFIHSIGMCRTRQFLAVLRSFFHSSLLCTFSCHPSPLTILPYSLTPSCHLFLGLPLNLVVPKFIYNTLLGILFSYILLSFLNVVSKSDQNGLHFPNMP